MRPLQVGYNDVRCVSDILRGPSFIPGEPRNVPPSIEFVFRPRSSSSSTGAGMPAFHWFILMAASTMARQQSSNSRCPACGAGLAPELRYCLRCYRPVVSERGSEVHREAVQAVDTTRRIDPTIVFLPDEQAALLLRNKRRKRAMVITATVGVVLAICSLIFVTIVRQRQAAEHAGERQRMALRELNLLADGLERFRLDMGRYPTDWEGLQALTRRVAAPAADENQGTNFWFGPYVDGIYEVDPWGNDYVYHLKDGGQDFELFSYGPDGEGSSNSRLEPSLSHSSAR